MNIKDANIIITGAASGFGREISISLGSEGANIFAIDIDEDSLQSLKETNKNINVPNTKSLWKIEGNSKLTPSSPIILSWINDLPLLS